jgi:hypothetical protein
LTAETAIAEELRREIYLDRRVCSVTPQRIDVHPARSLVVLPLLMLLLGIAAFPIMYFWGGSLSLELRMGLTLGALFIVPLSGIGLVYSIAGAHIVMEKAKQSAVLQQGYLGMGVGTQELIPFWKLDHLLVRELTPHDYRGHQDDFAQYEIVIVKVSGKEVPVGTVTVARAEAKDGLARAREVADLLAEMAESTVRVDKPARGAMEAPTAS